MKRVVLILIIVILVALAIFFGWYLFFKNPNVPASETLKNFLPFGSGDDLPSSENVPSDIIENGDEVPDELVSQAEVIFSLSETPVAGFVLLNRGTSTTVVRYVDRATGHIYDVNLSTFEKVKITNQTLPKIYEAHFREDGNAVLFRSLKDDSDVIENITLILTPPKVAATSSPDSMLYTVSSTVLRGDIDSVSVGSGDNLFYTLKDTRSIVSSTFTGINAKTILTSPFTNWVLATSGNGLIIHTKASASASGYAYRLNTSSGALTKILGPLNGLVVLPSSSGNYLAYSYVSGNETKLFAKNLLDGFVSEMASETIADKCVWSKVRPAVVLCGVPSNEVGAAEPDNWYRGMSSFGDFVWSFNTENEISQILDETTSSLNINFDVYRPRLSTKENFIVFINKIDLSLWAFKLGEF